MVSLYIQRQCRRFALLLLALGLATPAQARDIVETTAALFFTRDERPGIQMPTPEEGCCLTPLSPFGNPTNPIGPVDLATFRVTTETDRYWMQPDDFTESSVTQFRNLGIEIGQEAVRTRLRPFLAAWVYDTNDGTLVISDRALGPMLAERPQTMGKGRMAIGWSYQQVNWDRWNGQKLEKLQFRIDHKRVFRPRPSSGAIAGAVYDDTNPVTNPNRLPDPTRARRGQETDFIMVDLDVKLEQDYVDFYFEYGITDSLDISIVVPLVQTNLELTAFAGNVQQADPNDLSIDRREDQLELTFSQFSGETGYPTADRDKWIRFHSIRTHMFCDAQSNKTFRSLRKPVPGQQQPNVGCPGGDNDQQKGDRATDFFGGIRDIKDEKAIGIGDIRIRAKWYAIEAAGLIPDVAWIAEIRPPTGIEDDFQGTGALSTSNYLVTGWTLGPVRPHVNVGVEISSGPDWQDATEWAAGFEYRIVEWLSLSFDQLGRVPFSNAVSSRYEYGAGVKLVPTPGAALYFDFIKPINKNTGLTSDLQWRVGGQVQF